MDPHPPEEKTRTLSHVLEACKAEGCVPEKYWVGLLGAIARGDQLALHALYMRTFHLVFWWFMRITGDRSAAEQASLEVFCDVWRTAATYDASDGAVLAWILNRARSRTIDRSTPKGTPEWPFEAGSSLWKRVARRIAAETGSDVMMLSYQAPELEWEEVAPGISCTLLSKDEASGRVAMLVRLGRGVDYPPHTHAGVEELYMFEGELTVDDRTFRAGDYLRSEPGSTDRRVWSGTGCTGLLVTSTHDLLL